MTVPLTGFQYEIEAGPYRATLTQLGAGLRELLLRDEPVVDGYRADELPPGRRRAVARTLAEPDRRRAVRIRGHRIPAGPYRARAR